MIKTKMCIFCNERYAKSGEHTRPNWMNKVLPPTAEKNHSHTKNYIDNQIPRQIRLTPKIEKIGVPYGFRKLRIVCAECNTKWMSKLQESVKPLILPMIEGKKTILSPEMQRTITRWAIMTTIVNEYTDQPTIAVTPEERLRFYREKETSGSWSVWLGDYVGANYIYSHTGHHLANVNNLLERYSVQATTSTYGDLLVHTFFSTVPNETELIAKILRKANTLVEISNSKNDINWPPYIPINEEDAREFAHWYHNFSLKNLAIDLKHKIPVGTAPTVKVITDLSLLAQGY